MITETMTIHQALTELKTLDKRIESKIAETTFVQYNKHSNSKIEGKPIADYQNGMRFAFQSITDLINRRFAIRNALAKSNSETIITVGGKEYTVSTAIEMKQHGMALKAQLLASIARQFGNVKSTMERHNDRLSENADDYVSRLYGAKDKSNADDINAAREHYIKANTLDLIDPLDAAKKIEELRDEIDSFTNEIDSKISVSNALTPITISY